MYKTNISGKKDAIKKFEKWLDKLQFEGFLKEVVGLNYDGRLRYKTRKEVIDWINSGEDVQGNFKVKKDCFEIRFFTGDLGTGVNTMKLFANYQNVCNMQCILDNGRIVKKPNTHDFGKEIERAEIVRREAMLTKLLN